MLARDSARSPQRGWSRLTRCLAAAVSWELRQPDPVIDFRMLKVRNFAIANVFYFIFGFGLFATTTMIPQMLQQFYGFSSRKSHGE